MAVYTEITPSQAEELLRPLGLAPLLGLRGISGGIENTNYFVDTPRGEFVLTIFERLTHEQLPYYLYLTQHLAQQGIPVPAPVADADGHILFTLAGKPAAVVEKLHGASQLSPQTAHCYAVGAMLARMHVAGQRFDRHQTNLRDLAWITDTVPTVLPYISAAQAQLLQSELEHAKAMALKPEYAQLPQGPIHADLFRDNVMFEGESLTGFFDFYFAGHDAFAYDIAVVQNDWCVDLPTGQADATRNTALMQGYESVRPLQAAEVALMPSLLRLAALRFWLSRLWDFYLPRKASMLKAHDPAHFERILQARISSTLTHTAA